MEKTTDRFNKMADDLINQTKEQKEILDNSFNKLDKETKEKLKPIKDKIELAMKGQYDPKQLLNELMQQKCKN